MSVMIFISDFYSGLQSVLFPSVAVSDIMDNVSVSLDFLSVSSFSVEGYFKPGVLTLLMFFTKLCL